MKYRHLSGAEELIDEPLPALMAAEDRESLQHTLRRFEIADREGEWLGLAVPARGSPFQVALTAAVVRHADHSVYRIRWSVRDVSRRPRAD